MAIERLAPDVLLVQSNLSGAVSAIQDDPDSETGVWLTAPTLQSAAAKTFYLDDAAAAAGYSMTETNPGVTGALFHGVGNVSGWKPGNLAATRYAYLDYNTEQATFVTTEPSGAIVTTAGAGNFFRTANTLKGNFASGSWTLNMALRSVTRANTSDYLLKWRVWRSTDPTGATGATQVTTAAVASSTITATASTTADQVPSATWAAPAFSVADEYLFFSVYLQIAVAGGNTNEDLNIRKVSTSRVATAAFTSAEPDTEARASLPSPQENPTVGAGLQEFRALVRKKGAGTNPTVTLSLYEAGSLVSTLAGPTAVTSSTGQIISGTFNASGRVIDSIEADVLGIGAVGGSVEVGAIEWNANTTPAVLAGGYVARARNVYGADIAVPIVNTEVHVSFPTPPETLITGAGRQEFRVLVRKAGGGADPSATLQLYYDGSLISTLLGPTAVSSTSGVVLSATFDAAALPSLTGAGVELRVVGTGVGGGTLEVGAAEFNALGFTPQIIGGYVQRARVVNTSLLAGDPITVTAGVVPSKRAVYGTTVLPNAIQAGFVGPLTAGMYAPGRYPPLAGTSHPRRKVYGAALAVSTTPDNAVRVQPDAILEAVGLTGAVGAVQDDPDSETGVWLSAS